MNEKHDTNRRRTPRPPAFNGGRLLLATLIGGLALPLLPGVARSEDAAPGSSVDPALIQKLLKRVDELEGEVRQLRKAQSSPSSSSLAASEVAAAKDNFPQIQFHGFGDVTYHVNNGRGDKNAFALGQLDFFVVSRIADNISILNENVVEAGGDNNFGFEVERLLLQYRGNDWFNVDLGRYHTSIGYYNTAYHHGTWFQTATGRPQFLDFEDGGGLIPTHGVGLAFHGAIPSGSLNMNYAFEISNGRSYHSNNGNNPVLNVNDDNEYKAFNLALTVKPDGLEGVQAGAGVYHDTLTPENLPRTDEFLFHGHIVYKNSTWEWLNEGFLMRHHERGGGTHWSPAAYTQVARAFGKWKPYARFSYVNATDADNALTLIGANGLRWGPSVGIRYDFSSLAAIKLQYDRVQQQSDRNLNQFTTQVAFTF
ncbi:MAG TPA: hypothetical protein DCM86_11445 [Verrucomicrobiales bacterium]|nr:hypothetical protein [Verrucomicrobiales bacterium]